METGVARGGAAAELPKLMVLAPARGWLLPLEATPDPAFAGGALGPGVTLELLDDLIRAPCAGEVAAIAGARHAVTLDCGGGAQILIHCGIDTMALDGAPFDPLVEPGDRVEPGDPLLRVDLEALVAAGKSAATPIVLIETGGHSLRLRAGSERMVEPGAELFALHRDAAEETASPQAASGPVAVREVVLPLPHGLHARPSAAIAAEARRWPAALVLRVEGRSAAAISTVGLMKLGATLGARVEIEARGEDAQAAADSLADLIERGAGDEIAGPGHAQSSPAEAAPLRRAEPSTSTEQAVLVGVAAAPGRALGPAYYVHRSRIEVTGNAESPQVENARLGEALSALRERLAAEDHSAGAAIAAAQLAIVEDEELIAAVEARIDDGASAAVAWQNVMQGEAEALRALPDARLAERADDFLDLEQRVLRILLGRDSEASAPAGAIVIASDLYPSDLEPLKASGVAGIATLAGGPTSHLAILAASAGIPMAVAFGEPLCRVEEGELVHLDGDAGKLRRDIAEAEARTLRERLAEREASYRAALATAQREARLASGERIEVFANVGNAADAEEAARLGAEGSGLVRTEFLFLDRAQPPGEAEQADIYAAIMDRFGDRPVIFRTLDIGADKPAPYLPLAREDNPALGVRGIRIGLRYPELLATQMRAILRAAGGRTAHIMAPMIASADELTQVRATLDGILADTGHSAPVRLGAMIETPASALVAGTLAREADFLSVGTNDLTQYTLAIDRTNPELARELDPLHPAVTRLVEIAAEGCRAQGRPLGVCGGAAGDPLAAAVLVGLGAGELSVSAARVPELKQWLAALTLKQCRTAAEAALAAASAEDARRELGRLLGRSE